MQVNVQIDSVELITRLDKGQRRLAYAAVNAINKTAKRIQDAERRRVAAEFKMRQPEFMMRQAAIIKPFASVGAARPFAEIAVGQKRRLLLSAFERGAERKPFTPGAKRAAIPIIGSPARPAFPQPVPAEFTFKGLKLVRKKGARGKGKKNRTRSMRVSADVTMRRTRKGQWKGEHRTFLLTHTRKAPHGGVFQRVGPRRDDIRMIYSFKNVRLGQRLHFLDTAKREAARWFKEEMQRETVNAIARAKGRGV